MNKPAPIGRAVTRRREVVIARTREDILVAAARALAHSGFGAVSMQEIAREVGFTAPALYAYFESKEQIFAELGRTLGRELAETFEPPPPAGASFRQKLASLLRRQLEWTDRRRGVFVALFALRMRGEQMCFQKRGDPPGCMGPDDYLRRLGQWLGRAASEPGDLDGQDPAQAACVLMGITHGFFLRWLMAAERREERLADGTERILDVFFYGFSGQPGPVLARSDFSKGTFVAPRERRSRARRPA